ATTRVSGSTTLTDPFTGVPLSDTIGFYAQRTNSGSFHSARFAYIPEVDASLAVRLLDNVRVKVGYNLIAFEKAVRPGQQIDRNLILPTLFAPTNFGVNVPSPPRNEATSFLLQGATVGLEFVF